MLRRPFLIVIVWLISVPSFARWYSESATKMGTNIEVEVWAESETKAQKALNAVMAEMDRINLLMSPYVESSELSVLNREAYAKEVNVSKELYDLLQLSVEMGNMSNGAFDITFASVGFLYNYQDQVRPDEEQVESLLDAIDYRRIALNPDSNGVRFGHKNLRIDLGGIAKGHAVDNSIAILKAHGIQFGLVTAGGDTRLLGDRNGRPWMVGIRDPRNQDRQAVVLPLEDIALSTSGDYERYFEQDGKRYHHILSPQSGKSAAEVQSVSILGPLSVYNDALSTAVFVLGVKQGINLINRVPDYEAVIMDNQRKMHYSQGLQQNSTL